ncbi:flavodoxin family protein [Acetatifactor muris]|jgi:multimeric flavodoxin WrbA|uniref:FMN-dependent NADH-azoreductase 1 n=1 Tax=Acetatifactor muris TaxID=879566 RepID=A0A2K4ZMW0_9FIRM|nr:flavodoxin family protein [Acetatifactor muris]MCI8800451.1 flavodoxin family protein [Lachnospiraceae bacterium]MCR2050119.1 flavodoxin family protein [Acetatifactor muris]SOY31780.1 FMN-dependent NADH-azoreductase 1 [Acetatifactor muris]
MKVLVINGSPKGRKSNTWKLTEQFLEGMRESVKGRTEARLTKAQTGEKEIPETAERDAGEASFEIEEIQVTQLEIHPCLGCFSCWNRTPGRCCIQDDMQEVIGKLLWADVIIWSFPLYYFTVPGGLKNLIDRQLPMVLPFMEENTGKRGNGSHPSRYDMSDKKTVLISTCGFYTAEGNYDGVYSLFDHICADRAYTTVFCGQGELFRVPELSRRTGEYLDYVRKAGREYMQGGIQPQTEEALKQLLYPKEIFENMADASWGIDRQTGERESDALVFTRQMAGLYRKENYPGRELILEMYYTDLDECYQVVLGENGSQVVTDSSRTATTRIETPITVWRSIAAGEIRGDAALMQHLYRVTGDFSMMLNWDKYFGGSGGKGKNEKSGEIESRKGNVAEAADTGRKNGKKNPGGSRGQDRETNMMNLLIPWIVFWVAVSFDGYWGCFPPLAACVLVPFILRRNQKTIYDSLSGVLVTAFSMASLLRVPGQIVLPLSYFAFGVMWTASCLCRIPLTAYYSMNQYNGEEALANPIFMRTNRILTLLWGILYLVTPVWTYFLIGSGMGVWTGAVNSALPALMGIFTQWFQKWYPARVAAMRK